MNQNNIYHVNNHSYILYNRTFQVEEIRSNEILLTQNRTDSFYGEK